MVDREGYAQVKLGQVCRRLDVMYEAISFLKHLASQVWTSLLSLVAKNEILPFAFHKEGCRRPGGNYAVTRCCCVPTQLTISSARTETDNFGSTPAAVYALDLCIASGALET